MLRYLYRRGQLRGLLGGSRPWTVVWAVLLGARLVRKAATREEKVVYSELLAPGQTVVIRHERPGERPVERPGEGRHAS